GTFTIDETYESTGGDCTVTTHDVMALNWQSTYTTVLSDGTLAGTVGALAGQLGTLEFTAQSFGKPGCEQVAPLAFPPCSAALSGTGRAPALTVAGGSADAPSKFTAESATGVAPPGCNSAAQRDASVLGSILPGALTASGTLPAHALDEGGSYSAPVSSAQASPQAPSDCTASGQPATGTLACGSTLSWSGTVTFSPDCRKAGDTNTALPLCIKEKAKQDASQAAKFDHEMWKGDNWAYGVNCKPHDFTEVGWMTGGAGACVGARLTLAREQSDYEHDTQIADDPPDSSYTSVARPRLAHANELKKLRRFFPATYRLMRRYAQIAGLVGAVVTAQDRASGAFEALSSGNEQAAGYLAKQDQAELGDASHAARLLGGQHPLALRAAAELRRRASGVHGRGAKLIAKNLRRLASTLTSKRALRADRLAAAALGEIGT
ncbi:MAG: hypothetical protein ACRDPA_21270, partial [Solirubrobacteraceae bacterium]